MNHSLILRSSMQEVIDIAVEDKSKKREEIRKEVEEFLRRGGKITLCLPSDRQALTAQQEQSMLANERRKEKKKRMESIKEMLYENANGVQT